MLLKDWPSRFKLSAYQQEATKWGRIEKVVKEFQGCSEGWADALVKSAINSGKVRSRKGLVQNFPRRPEDMLAREITLVEKNDLLYWLDRNAPQEQQPATQRDHE